MPVCKCDVVFGRGKKDKVKWENKGEIISPVQDKGMDHDDSCLEDHERVLSQLRTWSKVSGESGSWKSLLALPVTEDFLFSLILFLASATSCSAILPNRQTVRHTYMGERERIARSPLYATHTVTATSGWPTRRRCVSLNPSHKTGHEEWCSPRRGRSECVGVKD